MFIMDQKPEDIFPIVINPGQENEIIVETKHSIKAQEMLDYSLEQLMFEDTVIPFNCVGSGEVSIIKDGDGNYCYENEGKSRARLCL